jgi:hypothetical protein
MTTMLQAPENNARQVLRTLLSILDGRSAGEALLAWPPDFILRVARHHRLLTLLAAERRKELPPALADQGRRALRLSGLGHLGRVGLLCELVAALTKIQVPCLVLKGMAYEHTIYPHPGARVTGDLDVLLPAWARRESFRVLKGLGFAPVWLAPGFDEPEYFEATFRRGPSVLDVHFGLMPRERGPVDYDEIWRDACDLAVPPVTVLQLAPHHAAAFHAWHMAKHHFDVPAVNLVDITRLIRRCPDPALIERTARRWRCWRSWRATFLTEVWVVGHLETARDGARPAGMRRIAAEYGGLAPLPRPAQLARKLRSFDRLPDALWYAAAAVRGRWRQLVQGRIRGRSIEQRLGF